MDSEQLVRVSLKYPFPKEWSPVWDSTFMIGCILRKNRDCMHFCKDAGTLVKQGTVSFAEVQTSKL